MNTVIAREPQFLNFKGCDWHTMAVNESKVDGGEKVNTSIKYVSASPCGMHSFQSRITTNRYKDHGSVLTIWANILDPLFPRVVLDRACHKVAIVCDEIHSLEGQELRSLALQRNRLCNLGPGDTSMPFDSLIS